MADPGVQVCRTCKLEKSLDQFHSIGRGKRRTICGSCRSAATVEYRKNPDVKRRRNDYNRRRLYGIKPEEFQALTEKQRGRCAVCEAKFADKPLSMSPHVDHDHKTGKVRGLLCGPCNFKVGYVEKHPGFVENAITYLLKYAPVTGHA